MMILHISVICKTYIAHISSFDVEIGKEMQLPGTRDKGQGARDKRYNC